MSFSSRSNAEPKRGLSFFTGEVSGGASLDSATPEEVIDRLETVRAYLGSLIDRIEADGDSDANEALAEALASIDMAAAGMWTRD